MIIFAKLAIILQKMKNYLKYIVLSVLLAAVSAVAEAQYDKDVFFFRGRKALSEGQYSEAIEHFNILARLDSTDYWTFFYRGVAKYNLGDIRGAQKDFNSSVRLNPVFTSGYHYRGITKSRFGDYDSALEDFEHAIALRPGYTGLYFSRGVTYFLAQQFDKAIADFDTYIRKEPKDPSAFLNRGASYLYQGDTTKALQDYDKAIKIDRYEPEGYIRRGNLYMLSENLEAAMKDYDKAISLDTSSTLAYYNRALIKYELQNYMGAMEDLNRVLRDDPGNSLTLYNRSLIYAKFGEYGSALDDMDRVIFNNPRNVLAYFNRASFFIDMGRWQDALEDYDKSIELYPDFAKAYKNRAYVELQLGRKAAAKKDYDTANRLVDEYRIKSADGTVSFADTTKKYNSLISFDTDFAKNNFDDEILLHRDIDIRLKPLYRFVITKDKDDVNYALRNRYENPLIDKFIKESPVPVSIVNDIAVEKSSAEVKEELYGVRESSESVNSFLRGVYEVSGKQFNLALNYFGDAISQASGSGDKTQDMYKSLYYMNRGVLRADMIDFISSIENNVQTLTMDDQGTTRARVRDRVNRSYDYGDAISDMEAAASIVSDIPYIYFNLGNLYCLSSRLVDAIGSYNKALELYPMMGDAYYNRGLVLIYLKDKEKGCIDLSRAGELGVGEAYSVIKRYCEEAK